VPERPGAWLVTTARNAAVDRLRRRSIEASKLRQLPEQPVPDHGAVAELASSSRSSLPDERLELIFTCCHPALSPEARIALTLRSLAGLSTAEIARAFLVSERTMGQRIFRARAKIRDAAIAFRVPRPEQLRDRLDAVLATLYLAYNEGYVASDGTDHLKVPLSEEAIRLTRLLAGLLPDEPETGGLLALMLFHHARRAARTDPAGDLIPLDEQDRTRWDQDLIAEATRLLDDALVLRRPDRYQVQAAIAACHATAADADDTDWRQIALLYRKLTALDPSPVVELNRAVAVAMADGPGAGLQILDAIPDGGPLRRYHLLAATRADLLRRLGRFDLAAEQYRLAYQQANTEPERRFLARRLREVAPGRAPGEGAVPTPPPAR
jgi:RNA polymerase sigma-70 factor (ECF subfamily)